MGDVNDRIEAMEMKVDLLFQIKQHEMRMAPAKTALFGKVFGFERGDIIKMYDGALHDGCIVNMSINPFDGRTTLMGTWARGEPSWADEVLKGLWTPEEFERVRNLAPKLMQLMEDDEERMFMPEDAGLTGGDNPEENLDSMLTRIALMSKYPGEIVSAGGNEGLFLKVDGSKAGDCGLTRAVTILNEILDLLEVPHSPEDVEVTYVNRVMLSVLVGRGGVWLDTSGRKAAYKMLSAKERVVIDQYSAAEELFVWRRV